MVRRIPWLRGFVLLIVIVGQFLAPAAYAQDTAPDAATALQSVIDGAFSVCGPDLPHDGSDAVYRICTPPWWWPSNGELVIWAHGYVDVNRPIEIPEDQLCLDEGLCIPDLVNFLGYDFATTSYAVNGLAVVPGLQDILELVDLYTGSHGPPERIYLVGASEGGLITTLAVEQHPSVFDGGLAMCGPIGDFARQVNYLGDFRTVFDYFYPELIPGGPTEIPPELMDMWDSYYPDVVYPVVFDVGNRALLRQLVSVTRVAFDLLNLLESVENSVERVLWYNVFATMNAREVLGGQPFDNMGRVYRGSWDDGALNAGVERFAADPAALGEIEAHYQTTGVLSAPLVTLHTLLDELVPYWHEVVYLKKTKASGSWPEYHENYSPTVVYGHCKFVVVDVLGAFDRLVQMVAGQGLDEQRLNLLRATLGEETEAVFHRLPAGQLR